MEHYSTFSVCGTVTDMQTKTLDSGKSIVTLAVRYGEYVSRGQQVPLIAVVEYDPSRIRAQPVQVGFEVVVGGEVNGRGYNGRYYGGARASSVTVIGGQRQVVPLPADNVSAPQYAQQYQQPVQAPQSFAPAPVNP